MGSYSDEFPFNIVDVVHLLNLKIKRQLANSAYVDCPFCGDKRGRMNISFVKNVWRCNHCDEHGGMLSLYAKFHNTSTSNAYWEIAEALCEGFSKEQSHITMEKIQRQAMTGTDSPALESQHTISSASLVERKLVSQSNKASPAEIHQTFSLLLANLTLRPAHREHLRSERRGLSDNQIDELGFKSTPPKFLCRTITKRLIQQGCTVKGVPGFYKDSSGCWTMAFSQKTSGILIPAMGFDGRIQGFQILLDVALKHKDDPPDKKGAKYIWFSSSSGEDGTSSGSPVHIIGDPCARVVYITEGLLKADISHCLTGRTFAAIAGANNTAQLEPLFAFLAQNGTEEIIEAHDMDKYSNQLTMNGASKIYLAARKYGINCRRLTWNPNYKGFDDWQLALRNEHQRRKKIEKLTFKEQYLHGLCIMSHIEDCTEQWHHLEECKTNLMEYLGLNKNEYGVFISQGAQELEVILQAQRKRQKFVLYQLVLEENKAIPFAFKNIEAVRKAGHEQPPAALYRMIGEGEIYCPIAQSNEETVKQIFAEFRESLPKDFYGRPMTYSDVLELCDSKRRCYYYISDYNCFPQVKFSPMLTKKNERKIGKDI